MNKAVKDKERAAANLQNPDMVQIALDAIMDQVVWGRAAEDAGYGKDPLIVRDAYLYKTELLARRYMEDRLDKATAPDEQEIQEFYDKNREHYARPVRMAGRHIQLATLAEAEVVLKKLLDGADFAQLARQYSQDPNTRDIGGALGYFSQAEGVLGLGKDPDFLAAALKLRKGELSPVIRSSRGYHVVLCEEREGGDIPPLNEVRDDVIKRVRVGGKISDVYNSMLLAARKKYKAEIFEDQVNQYTGTADSVDRLWEVVEMQPNERAQLEVLRRISFDFPTNDMADDAQLRIAYLYGVRLGEPRRAEKALANLKSRFPNSDLLPAADWLKAHLRDAQIPVQSFDELKAKGRKG